MSKTIHERLEMDKIEEHIKEAKSVLAELCRTGGASWRMCIPVQDSDTDRVLYRLLDDLRSVLGEIERLMKDNTPPTLEELRESGELFLCVTDELLTYLVAFDGDILCSDDHGFVVPVDTVDKFKRICDTKWTTVEESFDD